MIEDMGGRGAEDDQAIAKPPLDMARSGRAAFISLQLVPKVFKVGSRTFSRKDRGVNPMPDDRSFSL
jgi:hypothetical protein